LRVCTHDDGTAFVQENLNIGDWQILFQSWFPLSCWRAHEGRNYCHVPASPMNMDIEKSADSRYGLRKPVAWFAVSAS
jgi:hypothetical protein